MTKPKPLCDHIWALVWHVGSADLPPPIAEVYRCENRGWEMYVEWACEPKVHPPGERNPEKWLEELEEAPFGDA